MNNETGFFFELIIYVWHPYLLYKGTNSCLNDDFIIPFLSKSGLYLVKNLSILGSNTPVIALVSGCINCEKAIKIPQIKNNTIKINIFMVVLVTEWNFKMEIVIACENI